MAAVGDKVFVVYQNLAARTFEARCYDLDLKKERGHRVLVSPDDRLGRPTDIRVATDGARLLLFYETAEETGGRAYLQAMAVAPTPDMATLSASTTPLAEAPFHYRAAMGQELLDDPAPLVADGHVFVGTRLKATLFPEGAPIARIRELSPDLTTTLRVFDLNLSDQAKGGARPYSLATAPGGYALLLPTTTGSGPIDLDNAMPSDIVMITFDRNWNVTGSRVAAAEYGDTGASVSGLIRDGGRYAAVYRRVRHTPAPLSATESVLAMLGDDGRPISSEVIDATPLSMERRRMPRASATISAGRLYIVGETPDGAYVSVFDKPGKGTAPAP